MEQFKIRQEHLKLSDAVSNGYSELESLAEEMREWSDNMEEKLSHTEKYERVSECAETLEGFQEPDVPEFAQEQMLSVMQFQPGRRGLPRRVRRDNAVNYLTVAKECAEEMKTEREGKGDYFEAQCEELDELIGELEQTIDDAEAVEFPGMFG